MLDCVFVLVYMCVCVCVSVCVYFRVRVVFCRNNLKYLMCLIFYTTNTNNLHKNAVSLLPYVW